MSTWSNFWFGSPERFEQRSNLRPEQEPLVQQLLAAIQGREGGGAFGDVADYYRDLLSNDPSAFEAFAAPEMRRFKEDIIPGLSEQFAGLGAGSTSSSGFQQSLGRAGADLSERLANIRAGLRQQGAQGLQNLAGQGLNQFSENIYRPATEGFLQNVAGAAAQAIPGIAGNWAFGKGLNSNKGNSSPYGNSGQSGMTPSGMPLSEWRKM